MSDTDIIDYSQTDRLRWSKNWFLQMLGHLAFPEWTEKLQATDRFCRTQAKVLHTQTDIQTETYRP